MNNTNPKRELYTTADGSNTFFVAQWDEHYHSIHGAIQESNHVFIDAGLKYFIEKYQPTTIKIYEVGFGTGLNAFLTASYLQNTFVNVEYYASEAYPLSHQEVELLNFTEQMEEQQKELFMKLHTTPWNESVEISNQFILTKKNEFLESRTSISSIDLIYFDAFAPSAQPELWTEEIFKNLFHDMSNKGILVTYCAKGSVKRALKFSGWKIESIPGPPGKREMTRAFVNHD